MSNTCGTFAVRISTVFVLAFACLALLVSASMVYAVTWNESGDATDLPPGQNTLGVGSLNFINGEIDSSMDKDMYRIKIDDPALFSVSFQIFGSLVNSQLFLFDSAGNGVYANDDASTETESALLPAGNAAGPAAAGTYLLAVSGADNDPTAGALEIFTDAAPGVQTPVVAAPVDGWTAGDSFFQGTYLLTLMRASFSTVPEPSSMALAAVGLIGLAALAWRRRKR